MDIKEQDIEVVTADQSPGASHQPQLQRLFPHVSLGLLPRSSGELLTNGRMLPIFGTLVEVYQGIGYHAAVFTSEPGFDVLVVTPVSRTVSPLEKGFDIFTCYP